MTQISYGNLGESEVSCGVGRFTEESLTKKNPKDKKEKLDPIAHVYVACKNSGFMTDFHHFGQLLKEDEG